MRSSPPPLFPLYIITSLWTFFMQLMCLPCASASSSFFSSPFFHLIHFLYCILLYSLLQSDTHAFLRLSWVGFVLLFFIQILQAPFWLDSLEGTGLYVQAEHMSRWRQLFDTPELLFWLVQTLWCGKGYRTLIHVQSKSVTMQQHILSIHASVYSTRQIQHWNTKHSS